MQIFLHQLCLALAMPPSPMPPPASFHMVALDMDGTLLNANHVLSDESLSTLRSLSERGITVALCSGRATAAIQDHAAEINLQSEMPIVCFNGAAGLLARAPGWTTAAVELFRTPLPEEAVTPLLDLCEERGMLVQYYIENDICVCCRSDAHRELARRYATLTGVEQKHVATYDEARARGLPYKCLVMAEEDDVDETLALLRSHLPEGCATLIRGTPPFFVEVLAPNVNKGQGLRRICEALGMQSARVVAFGDGDNDVEFVQAAGLGVAMKNSRPTLRAVCSRVTSRDNDDDGVAHTLHELESEGALFLPAPRRVRGHPGVTIRRVAAERVCGVRERVLWPGQPDMCRLAEDGAPTAIHLAALDDGSSTADDDEEEGGGLCCGVLSLFMPSTTTSTGGGSCGRTAHFRKLAVLPEWRQRGIGGTLIDVAAAEARLGGATRLVCDARQTQAHFYEARGFVPSCGVQPFEKYPGKGGGALYVQMEMALRAR
jgi:Cof subfamily protein (haloacid dehalogenase superfamily)